MKAASVPRAFLFSTPRLSGVYGILPNFRGVDLFIPPTAIGSVPGFIRSRNCVPMAFTTESPPEQASTDEAQTC
ncbi:unnamed protein product [Ascophyllum nodosum]